MDMVNQMVLTAYLELPMMNNVMMQIIMHEMDVALLVS